MLDDLIEKYLFGYREDLFFGKVASDQIFLGGLNLGYAFYAEVSYGFFGAIFYGIHDPRIVSDLDYLILFLVRDAFPVIVVLSDRIYKDVFAYSSDIGLFGLCLYQIYINEFYLFDPVLKTEINDIFLYTFSDSIIETVLLPYLYSPENLTPIR